VAGNRGRAPWRIYSRQGARY